MTSEIYYFVRSKHDGQYLVARPKQAAASDQEGRSPSAGFLLMFQEYADALSYLNTHSPDLAPQFAIESIPASQLGGLLSRWGFGGVALVNDPLLPRVEFLVRNPQF